MIISVPVERIQLEYATDTEVCIPSSLMMNAPSESTILEREVDTSLVVPRNMLEYNPSVHCHTNAKRKHDVMMGLACGSMILMKVLSVPHPST